MNYIDATDYKLEVGNIEKSSFSELLTSYENCKKVIIVDENTHQFCLSYLITTFSELSKAEVVMIPEGEENKQMEIVFSVWEALTEYDVSRSDLVINLGGGMVTDMGGFIASCFKRGLAFINIPTSLLGMVDASIGGKTGINLGHFKNQIGVFSNPQAVFIDIKFLSTLPEEEFMSGYAEMLKHGLISNKDLFETIVKQMEQPTKLDENLLLDIITVKNEIVKKDPLETGHRKLLNFGHTIGHVIEGHYMETINLSHGHSIALGMLMEAFISMNHSLLNEEMYNTIEKSIMLYFDFPKFSDEDIKSMISMLSNDKKNKHGKIRCCLLSDIGECTYDNVVTEIIFTETFLHFKSLQVNLN